MPELKVAADSVIARRAGPETGCWPGGQPYQNVKHTERAESHSAFTL